MPGKKLSKSDLVLPPAEERAQREAAAARFAAVRCQHFEPGTDVMILGETFAVTAASADRRTLTLLAADGTERIVQRP